MNVNNIKKLIKESYITEVGDLKNIEPFKYYIYTPTKFKFDSNVGEVIVRFQKLPAEEFDLDISYKGIKPFDYIYNVSYDLEGVDSQYLKSNPKELFKILKTVTNITHKFLKSNDKYPLVVMGIQKDGTLASDKQKNSLYLTIISQNLPSGFRVSKAKAFPKAWQKEFDGIVIFKN